MNKILVFLLFVFLSNSIHAAQKVYAPFFEMINVHADYQYSSARLFKNYVDDKGEYTLVLPERHDTLVAQPSPDLAQKTAQSLNCPYYLLGDMNRVGETVILNVALYESKDGSRVWGDRLKASGPEDLDPIFQKLARAFGSSEKAAEAGDIYSVTDFESRELRQISVKNYFGIALGGMLFTPGILFGDPWESPFNSGFGLFWDYDSRNILFEVSADAYWLNTENSYHALTISVFKPFSAKSFTPFGGGGLGIARIAVNGENESSEGTGLTLQGGGGLIFNRTSNVQLRLQAKYMVGLFDVGAPKNEIPRAILLRMELAWGK